MQTITVLGRRETFKDLEPLQVDYRCVDIANALEMKKLKQSIQPTVVFNLAGVLRDSNLEDLTWLAFEEVLKPKVYGAQLLHCFFGAENCERFVLFSSMASLFPFPGQMNHAAANAFSDVLVHERVLTGQHALAINWGLWSDVGSATEAVDFGSRQGIRSMGNSEVLGLEIVFTF